MNREAVKQGYFGVFAEIIAHLLPLTKYFANGQYAKVQPIVSNFAERCICTILSTNALVLNMLIYVE